MSPSSNTVIERRDILSDLISCWVHIYTIYRQKSYIFYVHEFHLFEQRWRKTGMSSILSILISSKQRLTSRLSYIVSVTPLTPTISLPCFQEYVAVFVCPFMPLETYSDSYSIPCYCTSSRTEGFSRAWELQHFWYSIRNSNSNSKNEWISMIGALRCSVCEQLSMMCACVCVCTCIIVCCNCSCLFSVTYRHMNCIHAVRHK